VCTVVHLCRCSDMSALRDALRKMVTELGGDEAMSRAMWPHRDPVKGALLIRSWLNKNRRNKPDFEDIVDMLRVGRRRGYHDAIAVLLEDLNYARPEPVDPVHKLELLRQSIKDQQQALASLMDAYTRAQQDLAAIKGGAK
jgi:ribosomal 50S subunit-associated protein YjgA (DUF615 family)